MDIIIDTAELKERLEGLKHEEFVTVDTEFVRERTYYPLLCLVQLAGEKDAFAIDPLALGINLTPLYEFLGNKGILKVFHAAQQDIELFLNQTGEMPEPIFDTQIAAQVLGYGEAASYASLVEYLCEVELDKSSRYTDWSRRPLTQRQIDYAISDVTHLRKVYQEIFAQLDKTGRRAWYEEEMEFFTKPENYIPDPENIWKKIKLKSHAPKFLGAVKELAKWRELRAQRLNRPREWILKTETLLEIAAASPKNDDELKRIKALKDPGDTVREEILEALTYGANNPPVDFVKKKHLPHGIGPLVELLKVLLKMQSESNHVAGSIVASVDDLRLIAAEEKPDIPAMHGWRYEIFGKHALALKAGNLALTAEGNKIMLIEPAYESEQG